MKQNNRSWLLSTFLLLMLFTQVTAQDPVNPDASQEAKDLLKFLYERTGEGIISGNHNIQENPTYWDENLKKRNGNIEPAMYGNDFRYGRHVQYRQQWIDEAIHQYKNIGKIVTIMYHQARPMDDETEATFSESVQGNVTWNEMEKLLTEGEEIHSMWEIKMNSIAYYLQQLEDENIPVLFRPYHEMNGGWFWWGKKGDQFKQLYRMTYDYLTNEKGLDNLIWVLNYSYVDEDFAAYYPGDEYVDAFATDIYDADYHLDHYSALKTFANGKPIGVGETGEIITADQLKQDFPDYVWFMGWRDLFVDKMLSSELTALFSHSWVINDYKNYVTSLPEKDRNSESKLFHVLNNPYNSHTQIIFKQPLKTKSTLYVYTPEGKTIECKQLLKGTRLFSLELNPGTYFISFTQRGNRATKSIFVL